MHAHPKTYGNKSAKWHCGRHTLICKIKVPSGTVVVTHLFVKKY